MRIVIDLDGTICPVKEDGDNYADLKPYPGAVEKLRMLRSAGHYIIEISDELLCQNAKAK